MRTDVIDMLQNIATQNNLEFYYGEKDYINLHTNRVSLEGKKVMYVAPITQKTKMSINGGSYISCDVLIFIGELSSLNEDYTQKYINHIKPLSLLCETLQKQVFCYNDDFEVGEFDDNEDVNSFDGNLDGINCTFTITMNK